MLTEQEKQKIIQIKAEQQRKKDEEVQKNRKPLTEADIAKIKAYKAEQAVNEQAFALAKQIRRQKAEQRRLEQMEALRIQTS